MQWRGSDKRKSTRTPSNRRVRIVVRRHGIISPPFWVTIRDYSVAGIGVASPRELMKGDEIFLLPDNDHLAPVRYLYTVLHVRSISETEWGAGASFKRIERRSQPPRHVVAAT